MMPSPWASRKSQSWSGLRTLPGSRHPIPTIATSTMPRVLSSRIKVYFASYTSGFTTCANPMLAIEKPTNRHKGVALSRSRSTEIGPVPLRLFARTWTGKPPRRPHKPGTRSPAGTFPDSGVGGRPPRSPARRNIGKEGGRGGEPPVRGRHDRRGGVGEEGDGEHPRPFESQTRRDPTCSCLHDTAPSEVVVHELAANLPKNWQT